MDLDEEDPSEDWVSQSIGTGFSHTPNGPLGSEREKTTGPLGMLSPTLNGPNGNGLSAPRAQGIQIKPKKKKKDPVGSPLTNSVQENFRGFTYSGGESIVAPPGVLGRNGQDQEDEAVEDEEVPEVTTEDEFEDSANPAGRYANARRKGLGFSSLDDDMA